MAVVSLELHYVVSGVHCMAISSRQLMGTRLKRQCHEPLDHVP